MAPSIAIITGSIAGDFLERNVRSVNALDIPPGVSVQHWIVVDGASHEEAARRVVDRYPPPSPSLTRYVMTLPENTGGDGYLCHRIIAASSFVVNTDYMCVLDEDNELEPHHIISHLNAIGPHRWSFTLRSIIDHDSVVQCYDTCESMGNIRATCLNAADRLVDTNCYMFKTDLARELAPLWMVRAREEGKLEADRRICQTLITHEPRGGSTRDFTVRYRVSVRGGPSGSVSLDFFTRGNQRVGPWNPQFEDVYLFHFNAEKTAEILASDTKSPLAEWCMTILDDVEGVNFINGYDCLHAMPYDAVCLLHMCHPSSLPVEYLKDLKSKTHGDMTRILVTLEGPNLRHQQQWSHEFLKTYADVIVTYAECVLKDDSLCTVPWPHNSRFISQKHATSHDVWRDNAGPGTGTIAMVLENRQNTGTYAVNDTTAARAMDYMRAEFATGYGPAMTVVGRGWAQFCQEQERLGRPVPTLGYDIERHRDTKTPIDTYATHDFGLVLENCAGEGATGYVSEKFGDVLMAGAIPVYWSENVSDTFMPAYTHMLQGEGVWWIDARKCLPYAEERGLSNASYGEKLKLYLDTVSPEDIRRMKAAVLEHRQTYIESVGCRAYADALKRALTM